jgi:hypothetical protein
MPDFDVSERDPRFRILSTLDGTMAKIKDRITKPYQYRFVSAGQAKQAELPLARWVLGGEVGPQPVANRASFRALIYSHGRYSAVLAAFHRVTSVTAVEFGVAAAEGFRAGQLTVPCAALRCLIERIAHAGAVADAAKRVIAAPAPREMPLKPVLDLGETVLKAVYGTNRDWMKLAHVDLRTTPVKDVAFVAREDTADLKATNVLNAIDKLERRVPGSRLTYEVLCEFLHPNIGDLFGASLDFGPLTDRHGTRLLSRRIGLGAKHLEGHPAVHSVLTQMLDVSADIVEVLLPILDDLEASSNYALRLTKEFAHRMVKKYRPVFDNLDLCPCLSGLRVKDCLRVSMR